MRINSLETMPLPPRSRKPIGLGKHFRKTMSVSEQVVWERLRVKSSGFKFRRQHEVGKYVLDFYCAEARLCVEIDGEQHALRREKDEARDAFLGSLGVKTLRFRSLDFFDERGVLSEIAVEKILVECEIRSGRMRWE